MWHLLARAARTSASKREGDDAWRGSRKSGKSRRCAAGDHEEGGKSKGAPHSCAVKAKCGMTTDHGRRQQASTWQRRRQACVWACAHHGHRASACHLCRAHFSSCSPALCLFCCAAAASALQHLRRKRRLGKIRRENKSNARYKQQRLRENGQLRAARDRLGGISPINHRITFYKQTAARAKARHAAFSRASFCAAACARGQKTAAPRCA